MNAQTTLKIRRGFYGASLETLTEAAYEIAMHADVRVSSAVATQADMAEATFVFAADDGGTPWIIFTSSDPGVITDLRNAALDLGYGTVHGGLSHP